MTFATQKQSTNFIALAALATALTISGCKSTIDDPTLTANVKSALAGDPTISQQPITDVAVNGVVTLTGNVSDDTASSVAAQDAAKVKGVKEVVNSLTVAGVAVTPTITSPSAPEAPRPATRQERQVIATHQTLPPPPPVYSAPAPPPPPMLHNITVPAGTPIPIRITQTLDSQTTQPGTPFSGVVTHEVVSGGFVVIPAGSAVSGTVTDAKDATHFKGSSVLALQLTAIRRHGQLVPVQTETYAVEGKGRGTNTAEKVGGGAAVGALLGGIFGGGKGALIGAGAGAGGGAILQGATRGQQVQITSESVIRFRLANSILVQTREEPTPDDEQPEPGLQTR